MPILSDSFLQEVRMKTDIAELISNYVTLKKAWQYLCRIVSVS